MLLVLCALSTEDGWLMRHLPISKQRSTERESPQATKASEREEGDESAIEETPFVPNPQLEAFLDKYGRTPANYAAIAIYGGGHGYGRFLRDFPDDPKALAYLGWLPVEGANLNEVRASLKRVDPDNLLIELAQLQSLYWRSIDGERFESEQILRLLHEASERKKFCNYESELAIAKFELMRFQGKDFAESWSETLLPKLNPLDREYDSLWVGLITTAIKNEVDPAKREAAVRQAWSLQKYLISVDDTYPERWNSMSYDLAYYLEIVIPPEECIRLFGAPWEQEKKDRKRVGAVESHQQSMISIALEQAEPQVLVEMERIYRQSGLRNAERYLLENVNLEEVQKHVLPLDSEE